MQLIENGVELTLKVLRFMMIAFSEFSFDENKVSLLGYFNFFQFNYFLDIAERNKDIWGTRMYHAILKKDMKKGDLSKYDQIFREMIGNKVEIELDTIE